MKCPKCHHQEDKVVDSRPVDNGAAIRRRRECLHCKHRYTTYEKVESLPIFVIKKDGSREPFDREKILIGLAKACQKRPVSLEEMENIVTDIERQCSGELNRELPSHKIGEMLMQHLQQVDKVAYVRFASVYREFADVDSFMNEMKRLVENERKKASAKDE